MDPRIWMQQIWHTDEVKETVFNVSFSYFLCMVQGLPSSAVAPLSCQEFYPGGVRAHVMYTSICPLLWLLCMPTLRYLEIALSRENLMLSIQAGRKSWDARIKCCPTALSCQTVLCAMHWMSFLVAHILLSCNVLCQPYFKLAKYGPYQPCSAPALLQH